jgi:hypothetical protein
MNWYEENIEEPIRDIVKLLRNNGFNTTCSCGHEMYVEGDLLIDGELKKLHDLLYNYYCENKKIKPNYEITFTLQIQDGIIRKDWFYINLK